PLPWARSRVDQARIPLHVVRPENARPPDRCGGHLGTAESRALPRTKSNLLSWVEQGQRRSLPPLTPLRLVLDEARAEHATSDVTSDVPARPHHAAPASEAGHTNRPNLRIRFGESGGWTSLRRAASLLRLVEAFGFDVISYDEGSTPEVSRAQHLRWRRWRFKLVCAEGVARRAAQQSHS